MIRVYDEAGNVIQSHEPYVGNFPLWEPDPKYQGLYRVSSGKAFAAGWQTRPFAETALDCLSDFLFRANSVAELSDSRAREGSSRSVEESQTELTAALI